MALNRATVEVLIETKVQDKGLDEAAGRFGKFGGAMSALAGPATAVVAAIGGVGYAVAQSASATEQAMGAVDAVFGDSAAAVKGYAASAAESVGLSQSAYGQLAAVAGASLKSMGMSTEDAAKQTQSMIGLGADLAATFGGTTAGAVDALTAALRGEADPAEKLGLRLSQTAVSAKMAADGTDKLTGTAYDAAKAATIMQMATEQAAGANGAFAREADTAAGAQQIATAQFENAKSMLGEQLLPIMAGVISAFADIAKWVGENSGLVLTFVGIIGGLAAAVLAVNAAMAVANAAQLAWTAAQTVAKGLTVAYTAVQWALNAAFAANPVMLVVLAIAALIAGIVLLWQNCEGFREFFIGLWEKISAAAVAAWDAIKVAAEAVWNAIKAAAEAVWNAIGAVVDAVVGAIKSAIEGVKNFAVGVWNAIKAAAEAVWSGIKSLVEGVIGGIKSAIDGFKSFVTGVWDTIKRIGTAVWDAIKAAATAAINAIMTPINAVKRAVEAVISGIKNAIEWAGNLLSKIPIIGGLFGSDDQAASTVAATPAARFWHPVPGTPSLAAGGLLGGRSAATPGLPAGVSITVTGALDPVAVAEQIERLLRRQSRRTAGVIVR